MKLGIIGFPACGKTSLFNAVTGAAQAVGQYSTAPSIHLGTVRVHDGRMYKLRQFYKPKSFVLAHVECADVTGLISGEHSQKQISAEVLGQVRQVDAIVHVIRAFDSSAVPHVLESVDPRRDMGETLSELLFADLAQVEAKIKKCQEMVKHGGKTVEQDKKELALVEKLFKHLELGKPVIDFALNNDDERKSIAAFQFLTAKPILNVFNVGEGDLNPGGRAEELEKAFPGSIALCAKLEAELAQLPDEERDAFLRELGIKEAAAPRLVHQVYNSMGLISFFTVGEDECRAWTIHKGDTAVQAAGKIHTDLAKGFIKAEVFTYDELEAAGGDERAMKAKHPLRLESKDYVVKDGDVLCIRANTR